MLLSFQQLVFHIIQMKDIKRLLKLFKICGRIILGIKVTLDNSEWKVYIDKVQSLDYNVARMGWLGDFNDPINFLEMYYSANGGNNDTGWENPEFQKLLDQSAYRTQMLKNVLIY